MFNPAAIKHTTVLPFFIKWYMVILGFQGLTTPWKTVYYANQRARDSGQTRIHEMKHAEQMDREGIWKFLLKYNYYWITKGYRYNPYEVEARLAAGQPI